MSVTPPALVGLVVAPRWKVSFRALCPTCGHDATWTAWRRSGTQSDGVEHQVACPLCDRRWS
jgi:hypothetical protein